MSDFTPVPSAPPPAPAPKSGSSALKIILIILGAIVLFFVLVVVGGLYACSHFVHSLVNKHGDKTTLNIPGQGSFSVNEGKTYSADELGTDIYPGAQTEKGGSSMDLPNASMVTGVFSTTDPVSKVEAFYKDKFGSSASDYSMGETAILTKKVSENETVTVTVSSKSESGKTKIVIMHSKKK